VVGLFNKGFIHGGCIAMARSLSKLAE